MVYITSTSLCLMVFCSYVFLCTSISYLCLFYWSSLNPSLLPKAFLHGCSSLSSFTISAMQALLFCLISWCCFLCHGLGCIFSFLVPLLLSRYISHTCTRHSHRSWHSSLQCSFPPLTNKMWLSKTKYFFRIQQRTLTVSTECNSIHVAPSDSIEPS